LQSLAQAPSTTTTEIHPNTQGPQKTSRPALLPTLTHLTSHIPFYCHLIQLPKLLYLAKKTLTPQLALLTNNYHQGAFYITYKLLVGY
jgi:hypothetical protein